MKGQSGAATAPQPRVIRAEESDLDALSQVIADAFHDLPPSRWLIADARARRAIFPGYFRIHVEHALADGQVHTTEDRAAVALWLPLGAQPPAQDPDYDAQLAAVTSPWTSRFRIFDAALERRHPADAPHHHLAILAVRPDRQGQGAGTALMRAHHAILDDAGLAAYLEAASRRTQRLYHAHGYEDHGPPIRLAANVCMYPMWRNPRHQRQEGHE